MPYYGHATPHDDGFAAVVDAHYAEAIHVATGFQNEDDALSAANAIAKGLNLRDYEQLKALGITDADLQPDEPLSQEPGDSEPATLP